MTEAMLTIDEIYARKVIDLSMRIGEALIAVGASANEVALSTTRVAGALGVRPVHVDITYNSIGVSYHRDETELPFTLLRVVRAPVPDHSKLQQLQALVADIQSGLDLDEARTRFHVIRRMPFRYRPAIIVMAQGHARGGHLPAVRRLVDRDDRRVHGGSERRHGAARHGAAPHAVLLLAGRRRIGGHRLRRRDDVARHLGVPFFVRRGRRSSSRQASC